MRFVIVLLVLTGCVGYHQAPLGGATARAAREYEAHIRQHDAPTIATARELTKLAVDAGRRGDCLAVEKIRARVLALPKVSLEGGVHDGIFLREPIVLSCLADQKRRRDQCLLTQRVVARSMIGASDERVAVAMRAMPICKPADS